MTVTAENLLDNSVGLTEQAAQDALRICCSQLIQTLTALTPSGREAFLHERYLTFDTVTHWCDVADGNTDESCLDVWKSIAQLALDKGLA